MTVKPGNGGNGERDPRLDLLYRDAAREGPPAHLDAAILAAARREVGARPRALSALRRWRVPVSIAAVVVVSASLVTLVGEKDPLMIELQSVTAPPMAGSVEPQAQPAEPAKPAEDRQRGPAVPETFFSARRDEAAAKAPPELGKLEKKAADGTGPASGDRRAATAPESDLNMAAPPARESPQRPATVDPKPQERSQSGVPDAAAQAKPMARAGQAEQEFSVAERAKPAPGTSAQRVPQPGGAPAAPQAKSSIGIRGMAAEPLADSSRLPVWHGLEQEPPQKWLERLADLRKQGRTGEASELLVELKRRFPDHPLPSGVE